MAGFTTVDHGSSGDRAVYEYNTAGQLKRTYDAFGRGVGRTWLDEKPATTTARTGPVTTVSYDAAARPETVTETSTLGARTAASYTYMTAAGSAGAAQDHRLATSTDAAGVVTEYGYSPASSPQPTSVSVVCPSASTVGCPVSGKSTTTIVYDTAFPDLVARQTDPDGVKTEYTYWPDRSLKEVKTFPDGSTPSVTSYAYTYPTAGAGGAARVAKIVTETAPGTNGPRVTETRYDAQGRVLEARDPLYNGTTHKATRNQYGADGSLRSTTDPADRTTTYATFRPGAGGAWPAGAPAGIPAGVTRVEAITDPDGISDWTLYDRSGDAVEEWHGKLSVPAEIAKTKHTYGALARLSTTLDPMGAKTHYHYDAEGRVTGVTTGDDPDDPAHTVSTEFDDRGQVLSETTPMGLDPDGTAIQRKTTYTYDTAGRKTSQLEGAGGPADEQLLTGYLYDDAGRLWRTIEHRHSYTDTANPTVIHTTDRVTETRYTPAGRTAETLSPPVDSPTFDWSGADSTKAVTSYTYDDAGRQLTVEGPDGGITETAYGADGRVESVTSPGGIETGYRYDDAGRRTGVVTPSGLTGPGDPATVTAVTGYDAASQVISQSDPHVPVSGVVDPSTRFTQYTPGGRVDTVTDALGNTVTYSYDSRGNRTSRTALNDAGAPVVESWTYNLADQVLTHTVPPPEASMSAKTTTSTYDREFGRLATVTDPTSRVQAHAYYNDGTLRSTTFTRTGLTTSVAAFWVNGRGWRTKSTLTAGTAVTPVVWTYDRAGQVLSEKTRDQNPVTHTYGLAGDKRTLGYPDGAVGSYLHDPAGRITEVSLTSGGVTVPYASYTYDADGRETSELIHAAGGAVRTRSYDDAGRLDSLQEVLPSSTSTWETYTAVLTHRPDGRLGTETVNAEPTITYGYDDAGQMTSAVDGVRDRSWTYGTRGNRLTAVDDGVTTTYDTSPNGSVAKTTTGSDTVTYRYDDAGRQRQTVSRTGTTTTASTSTTFDTRGLPGYLTSAVTSMATKGEYRQFDADGKYIGANIFAGGPSLSRHYTWDTTGGVPQIIQAKNQGAITFRSVWGNRRIGFKPTTSAPQWFQYDVRDSVIRTDPANTDVVEGPESYGPHGEAEGTLGYDSFGYRSELTNSALVHLRNRDYDPVSGQFTSRDPLDGVDGTPGVANPYQYADNDPANRADPLGLRSGEPDSGIEVDPKKRLQKKMEDAARESQSGGSHTIGACVDGSVSVGIVAGLSSSASACLLIDSTHYWTAASWPDVAGLTFAPKNFTSVGDMVSLTKAMGLAATIGPFASNASAASNLRGKSLCGSVFGGSKWGGEVTVCLGTKRGFSWTIEDLDDIKLSGIWSVYVGGGWGAGFSTTFLATSTGMHKVRSRFRVPVVNRDPVCEALFIALPGTSNLACPKF